ncbi:UDP-N-acetylmuramate dehydrogenase [Tindallia magadiensis]|uniref:UDP-N-acetylmuramate dehydrogenase n=1 Tax=Tindallia magadiensis TaxID=69895 RepID=UPI0038CD572C
MRFLNKARCLTKLEEQFPAERFRRNEPMSQHTSFQIGGKADVLIMPISKQEIIHIIRFCNENKIPLTVIGKGSNLLVMDAGIEGIVMKIGSCMKAIHFSDEYVYAEAGISLNCLAKKIQEMSLVGFEFASGIPGTLGGALTMNAGAYGGEMKNILSECTTVSLDGKINTLDHQDMKMGYRSSRIQATGEIIVEAVLKLQKGDREEIKNITNDYWQRRLTKQPYDLPSAGSVFKRPEGFFAGKLIEDCGLKGCTVGKAKVSELHAGFIVNMGGATASDVLSLMEMIKNKVREKYEVELESELRIIGRS